MRSPRALLLALPWLWVSFILGPAATFAQTSASYDERERVFNQGGHPSGGIVLSSPSFRITLDSIGEGLTAQSLQSTTYSMTAGLAASNRPPGEVTGVLFLADRKTMLWDVERSTGDYNLYRGPLTSLPGSYGSCRLSAVPATTATLAEIPPPVPIPRGFFYLITAENRLDEEGTMGFTSAGTGRANSSPCP